MREADIEIVLERAREKFPDAHPRVITDNGPQFIARDFHEFIRLCGMTHVRTSPYYPQSNGKVERWHGTLKRDCLRRTYRCRSMRRVVSSKASWSITTTSACTARSATSRRPSSSPAVTRRSSPRETGNSKPPVKKNAKPGGLHLPVMMDYNTKRPGRRIGQRRGATRGRPRGPRSKDGRWLHVPSSFPFDLGHQSDKPDWHDATDTTAGCLTKSLTPEGQNSISR